MMTELHIQQVALTNSAWYLGNLVSVLISGAHTDGRFALIQSHEIKGCEPPRHVHHHEDEILYVLEGHVQVSVGEAHFDAGSGTAVLLPRGSEHSVLLYSATAELLLMLLPAGLEDYFNDVGAPATYLYRSPAGSGHPNVEQLITTAARYGMEITGPP
jgi:quercetin dioxygenase-like cupin family protein